MPSIRVLPPDLADKIAAGEVVERPASVVKELVENALDAGSTHIRVSIDRRTQGESAQGGIHSRRARGVWGDGARSRAERGWGSDPPNKIEISDNGCGMNLEEAKLSLQRHATSKISSLDDLFAIRTLGFRGEALPSIASVSHLVLETKPAGSREPEGARLVVRGTEVIEAGPVGCPVGTRVAVSDLFYNTPARRKFLKSDGVELGHIEDVLVRLALSRAACGFEFVVDGRTKWQTAAGGDPKARLKVCLGKSFVEDAFELAQEVPLLKLSGWLVHPRNSSANANAIYLFLNGRFLRDRVLQHALIEGYSDFLMKGQYPKALLYVEMPPDQFDVNVHPVKREVRFVKPQVVHQLVAQAVRKAVQSKMYSASTPQRPESDGASEPVSQDFAEPRPSDRGIDGKVRSTFPGKPVGASAKAAAGASPLRTCSCETGERKPSLSSGHFAHFRVLGVLAKTYILCESPQGRLVLIDQHAAHERIGYEKLKEGRGERGSQRLAFPLTWEAGPKEAALLQAHLPALREAGLDIEPFGGSAFAIQSCPALIPEKNIPKLLEQISAELETLETATAFEKVRDHVLKTMACHAQVRAGDPLSREEIEHLLQEMDARHATHCPHGRPTFVEISLVEVEKWFKRT